MIYDKQMAVQILKPRKAWSWSGNDYSGFKWLESSPAPTEAEIDAEVTRLNNAEPMRLLRVERDTRLKACDWRASSDQTLSNEWKTYRQALRDLPASSTPKLNSKGELDLTSVTFPTQPS